MSLEKRPSLKKNVKVVQKKNTKVGKRKGNPTKNGQIFGKTRKFKG